MGRPSKLTEAQWALIQKRMLDGESRRALAKEFGLAESTIRERLSAQVAEIKDVATRIVATERALTSLPLSAQVVAHNLAARLRSISDHLAGAADHGAAIAHRLSGIAAAQVQLIDDADPLCAESIETLKGVSALTRLSNDASTIGMNLLAANKDRVREGERKPVPAGLGHFYGDSED